MMSAFRLHRAIKAPGIKKSRRTAANADRFLVGALDKIIVNANFDAYLFEQINLDNQITPIHLPTRLVVSLGLLVNELAENAVKYAFVTPGEQHGGKVSFLSKQGALSLL